MAAEKNFENKVKKFLKENGCWILKYWGGAAFTRSGIPDLLVCCKGRFIGVELKAAKGRPSDRQLYNLEGSRKSGGYGVVLLPDHWELLQNFILCILAGDMVNAGYNYDTLKSRWKHFDDKIRKGDF